MMTYYKLLTILLTLIPFFSQAQKIPEFYLKSENRVPITKGVLIQKVPSDSFKHYSTINISADEGDYKISYYSFTYLPERGELLGPFKISNANSNNIFKGLRNNGITWFENRRRLRTGDKIIIENIGAYCNECPRVKKITFKSIVIFIE